MRDTEAGERTADDIIATTGNAGVHVAPPRPRRPGVDRRVRRRLGRPAAHPRQQRRRDGAARAAAHARGLGAAVRDQPPRPLRARRSACTTRSPPPATRASSSRQLERRTGARRSSSTTSTSSTAPYEPWPAYGQSKTANVLFAVEATSRWAADGITANALMPGRDPHQPAALRRTTGDARGAGRSRARGPPSGRRTEQGAATSVLLATSPQLEGIGGRYFEDCNEAAVDDGDRPVRGVRSYALDPEVGRAASGTSRCSCSRPRSAPRGCRPQAGMATPARLDSAGPLRRGSGVRVSPSSPGRHPRACLTRLLSGTGQTATRPRCGGAARARPAGTDRCRTPRPRPPAPACPPRSRARRRRRPRGRDR